MANKNIKQTLIMAGGFGTRLGKDLNPKSCKSLIEYKGQTLIAHLIDNLKSSGIENIIIATNKHSHEEILEIAKSKNINPENVIIENGELEGKPEYGEVPYKLLNILENRFLMICGHHVVSEDHIKNMINKAKIYINIMSLYKNNLEIDKQTLASEKDLSRLLLDENNNKLKEIKGEDILSEKEYLYARNPYILDKDIIKYSHGNNHVLPFGEYILKENKNRNTSIGFVINEAPAEFDYPFEFEETKKYLDNLN